MTTRDENPDPVGQDRPSSPIAEVRRRLHRTDPYEGFDASARPFDPAGWYGDHGIFAGLVHVIEPSLVVEVGSWLGQSTRNLARSLRSIGGARGVLAIDTWLGAREFWNDHDDVTRYGALALHHGYPQAYYQFLANVVHAELQDWIVPFPTTSTIGAGWLAQHRIRPELAYIDASHDRPDIDADLSAYWNLLASRGVMFGDDFDEHWPSVQDAVTEFVQRERIQAAIVDDHYWVIAKDPTVDVSRLIEDVRIAAERQAAPPNEPVSSVAALG